MSKIENHSIRDELIRNEELAKLENEGFRRGEKKGKRLDVPFSVLSQSLRKQYEDWRKARLDMDKEEMKRALADLRNVAGIIFLEILERKKLE